LSIKLFDSENEIERLRNRVKELGRDGRLIAEAIPTPPLKPEYSREYEAIDAVEKARLMLDGKILEFENKAKAEMCRPYNGTDPFRLWLSGTAVALNAYWDKPCRVESTKPPRWKRGGLGNQD